MLFNEFLFMGVVTHGIIEWFNGCERSECYGLPVDLCQAYLQEVVCENSPSDHEHMIHMMPCRNESFRPWTTNQLIQLLVN